MPRETAAHASDVDAAPRAVNRWWLLIAVLGAGVLMAGGWAYWWWTHPNAFGPYGNAAAGQVDVGRAMHYDTWLYPAHRDGEEPEHIPVTLEQVRPIVTENSADVDIEVRVCRVTDPAQASARCGASARSVTRSV